jgi:transmembrane sensor
VKDKVEIIYSFLSGTSTEEEMLLFNELMEQKEDRLLFEQLQKIWEETPNVKKYKEYDSKRAFYELSKRIETNRKLKRRYIIATISGIAASILLIFGLWGLTKLQEENNQAVITFKTETGNRSELVLPDGSKVWLNAQTQINYSSDFGKSNRNVSLSGEAYFDVSHSNKPFIVDVKDFKVKVHGTKFDVSAYPDDKYIRTSLESGKISIKREGKDELIVNPGQLIKYERKTSTFQTGTVDPEKYSAWRSNKMYLDNELIIELTKKLERQYNVIISFVPESLGNNIHYSGVFTNENITEVLDAISIASGLKYTKKDNNYTIEKK